MRSFPLVVIAGLFCCLVPASAWAQQLHCHPCVYAFGKVQVGKSSSYSVQLTNTGSKTLRITSKSEEGSSFFFGSFSLPVQLAPGASIELPVIFKPTAKGYTVGVFTLKSNDPDSPVTVHVHGTGFYPESPELAVTPTTLSFGSVMVGSSASLQATLKASIDAVTISSDQSTSSEFAILGLDLPVTIQPGKSLAVTIQFTPNASGRATAKAAFTSNAVDSPTVEALTGTGVAQESHSVSLSWDSGGGNPVGYNVYRGTVKAGPFEEINTALDSSTNYTDSTVVSGKTYYYVTTEVNDEGQESAYSNEVEAMIPNN
jgi:hypothetical protein